MSYYCQDKRLVDAVVNKTNYDAIYMYEQGSGKMIRAESDKLEFPAYSPDNLYYSDGSVFCYIVTKAQLAEIRRKFPGRPLDDIGILSEPISSGRKGRPVGKIFWGKDPNIEVLFCARPNQCRFPHY